MMHPEPRVLEKAQGAASTARPGGPQAEAAAEPRGIAIPAQALQAAGPLELSVVLPCLDEADTLERVILKAKRAMELAGIRGEVIVADNGSTDGSREIALAAGARLVDVAERGYGSALAGGFRAASGRYVLMGDADDSYDMHELGRFLDELRRGSDLVQGCRLPAGGGAILPGAMPPLHRWLGNPMLSFMARVWLGVPVHDIYCGMRAFRRDLVERLDLRTTGMEFATEMMIQCARAGVRVTQVPITLHRDGRVSHPPHLRTVRDGWRTLRLFLASGPSHVFEHGGILLLLAGLLGYGCVLGLEVTATLHSKAALLVLSSLAMIGGHLSLFFSWVADQEPALRRRRDPFLPLLVRLEPSLAVGFAILAIGIGALLAPLLSEGLLDGDAEAVMVGWLMPASTLAFLGMQSLLFAVLAHTISARRC